MSPTKFAVYHIAPVGMFEKRGFELYGTFNSIYHAESEFRQALVEVQWQYPPLLQDAQLSTLLANLRGQVKRIDVDGLLAFEYRLPYPNDGGPIMGITRQPTDDDAETESVFTARFKSGVLITEQVKPSFRSIAFKRGLFTSGGRPNDATF